MKRVYSNKLLILLAVAISGCASKTDQHGMPMPSDLPTVPVLIYPAEVAQVLELASRFCQYTDHSADATILDVDACEDAHDLVRQLQMREPAVR